MAVRDDMFEVQLRIIQEIRQNPLIYDKAHRNHFKSNMRRNILMNSPSGKSGVQHGN